jgi:hypothetical protein
MRARTTRALLAAAAALTGAAAIGVPSAQAKLEHVDVYTATLTMDVTSNATSIEGGWSQVVTTTSKHGTLRARVDGLEFVDGIPSQATKPFSSTNVTDLVLDQRAHYTSPLGDDEGECHATSTETRPIGTGMLGTGMGADAEDGTGQIQLAIQSPEKIWIEKTCSGYLEHEFADPLIGSAMFESTYVPVSWLGLGEFDVPVEGTLPCPDFIRIIGCNPAYEGTVHFERTAAYERGQPDPPAGAPGGAPLPPAPTPPPADATDQELEDFGLAVLVRAAREDPYTQAVLRCGKPCEGKVSAYAIALSRQGRPTGRATKLGTTAFRSATGGRVTSKLRLSPREARLVQRRGGVQLRAQATPLGGGATVRSSAVTRVR